MTPERFEDLLDAFDRDAGDEQGLALAFREQVIGDLAGAKRLLEEGEASRAQQALDEALRSAREIVADRIGRGDGGGTAEGSRALEDRSATGSRRPFRVVIADDNPTRRALHRTLLEEAGPFHVVGEAEDSRRTLDAVRARAPDLVLLDLATPEEDSLAALPELKRTAPDVPVAALPAFTDDAFAARAREAGVDLYLEKGVGGAELVDRLHELVSQTGHRGR